MKKVELPWVYDRKSNYLGFMKNVEFPWVYDGELNYLGFMTES